MADNYLEKRMDDYRRGAKSYRPKLTPTGRKAGEVVLRFSPKRLLIMLPVSPVTEAIIKEFASVGCKVAFICEDTKLGNKIAQATGSRCLPVRGDDPQLMSDVVGTLIHDWGDIDIMISGADSTAATYIPVGEGNDSESLSLLSPDRLDTFLHATLLTFYTALRKLIVFRSSLGVANPYGRVILIGSKSSFEAQLLRQLRPKLEALSISGEIIPGTLIPDEISRAALLSALR